MITLYDKKNKEYVGKFESISMANEFLNDFSDDFTSNLTVIDTNKVNYVVETINVMRITPDMDLALRFMEMGVASIRTFNESIDIR